MPLPRRWAHVQSVAARAWSLAPVLGADADLLQTAGRLHDIGYAPGLAGRHVVPRDAAADRLGPGPPHRAGRAHPRRRAPTAAQHGLRDTAYDEDANTGYAGNGPQAMATLRNLAISLLYLSGVTGITRTLQAIARDRNRVLDYLPL